MNWKWICGNEYDSDICRWVTSQVGYSLALACHESLKMQMAASYVQASNSWVRSSNTVQIHYSITIFTGKKVLVVCFSLKRTLTYFYFALPANGLFL